MGRWSYYSPLLIGALLVLSLADQVRQQIAPAGGPLGWLAVWAAAVAFGVHCQVLMVGAQGAFAQVLPVPRGRSIRGSAAAAAGWLLIAWCVLAMATLLLGMEAVTPAAWTVGIAALAALLGAGLVYAWNIPAAVEDFGAERPGR
ncbi:MAG: hypothetical protein IPM13_07490 [Phycisphaerales bacterium]|nr:hypothetical protein [Phycisphaerales bacterium]